MNSCFKFRLLRAYSIYQNILRSISNTEVTRKSQSASQTTQTNIGKKVAVARALGERELLCQKVTFMCHK